MEDGAAGDQVLAQGDRVGEVAIVSNGHAAAIKVSIERLDIAHAPAAGGGVAGMSNTRITGK